MVLSFDQVLIVWLVLITLGSIGDVLSIFTATRLLGALVFPALSVAVWAV